MVASSAKAYVPSHPTVGVPPSRLWRSVRLPSFSRIVTASWILKPSFSAKLRASSGSRPCATAAAAIMSAVIGPVV